ncbi:Fc.00g007480.m01.CDS01 [Cosmosporella sp. VM-42]
MFTTLPDFIPRDSHSLWYTSSRKPLTSGPLDALPHADAHNNQHAQNPNHARQRAHLLERSALARLAADEQNMLRRGLNVQNYGSHWLKPPGVPKTLHQMREEKREQAEHQEAMRREQLAQELAEAEADGMAEEEGMMDDVQLDGAQDLDDEVPDADDYGLDDDDDDDDDDDEEDEDEEEEEAEEEENEEALREERQNDLMAARIRMNDDAFREALIRGDPDGDDMYGGEEELEEEGQGHMLGEDDFADDGLGMEMGADLDDDIPEAESGGYEHTDSEAELTSSEEEQDDDDEDDNDNDISFAPRSATIARPLSPTLPGRLSAPRASMAAPRSSMDLSNLLSQDGSSFMESSPAGRRSRR